MSDYGESNLKKIFKKCFSFIESAINKKENILIHCRGGINRSATVVIGYLMIKENMTLKEAFDLVKSKRPKICPHIEYIKQLKEYEYNLRGEITLNEDDIGPSLNDKIQEFIKLNIMDSN